MVDMHDLLQVLETHRDYVYAGSREPSWDLCYNEHKSFYTANKTFFMRQ
jgi:hypothetical protein